METNVSVIENLPIQHIQHVIGSRFKVMRDKDLSELNNLYTRILQNRQFQISPFHIQAFQSTAVVYFHAKCNNYGDKGLFFTINKSGEKLAMYICRDAVPTGNWQTRTFKFVTTDMDKVFALSDNLLKVELLQQHQIDLRSPSALHPDDFDCAVKHFPQIKATDIGLTVTGSVLCCNSENIHRYSQDGQLEDTINIGADLVTETVRRDICAVKGNRVFLINQQKEIIHTFVGAEHKSSFSSAVDAVSDSHGRILVAEKNKIHLLDKECRYVGIVVTSLRDGIGEIMSIDVDIHDNLWLLDKRGYVWVVKYNA